MTQKASPDKSPRTACIPIWMVFSLSLLLRHLVSLWPYSGADTPPMYGDYEAQRHWMEMTVNLPIEDWYRYDLPYWGLDYPPLTAYISWVCGMLSRILEPASMALDVSRGYETPTHKAFMRLTVLILDLVIFFPAAIALTKRLSLATIPTGSKIVPFLIEEKKQKKQTSQIVLKGTKPDPVSRPSPTVPVVTIIASVLLALMQPPLVLIDHGHFQYNSVCLGLAMGAAVTVCRGGQLGEVLGSILFCLSLNFKQMALYYSPAFFFFLLASCITPLQEAGGQGSRGLPLRGWVRPVAKVLVLGVTVGLTFATLWWPFCVYGSGALGSVARGIGARARDENAGSCLSSLGQVFSRQFPFSRGLFEDKVANLWFCADVILKLRQRLPVSRLAKMAMGATLCLLAPVGVDLMRPRSTLSPRRLVLALFNTSMAFFLCSFQVHEKSILLPLCPLAFLWADSPLLVTWLQVVGSFSLKPLLEREGLVLPCVVLTTLYICTSHVLASVTGAGIPGLRPPGMVFPYNRCFTPMVAQLVVFLSSAGMMALVIAEVLLQPPEALPHLYPTLNAAFSCINLLCAYVLGLYWQWCEGSSSLNNSSREGFSVDTTIREKQE